MEEKDILSKQNCIKIGLGKSNSDLNYSVEWSTTIGEKDIAEEFIYIRSNDGNVIKITPSLAAELTQAIAFVVGRVEVYA